MSALAAEGEKSRHFSLHSFLHSSSLRGPAQERAADISTDQRKRKQERGERERARARARARESERERERERTDSCEPAPKREGDNPVGRAQLALMWRQRAI